MMSFLSTPLQLLWWDFAFKSLLEEPDASKEEYHTIASSKARQFLSSDSSSNFQFAYILFQGVAFNNRKKVLEFQIYLKGWPAFAQHLRHLSCQRLMVGSWNPAKFWF